MSESRTLSSYDESIKNWGLTQLVETFLDSEEVKNIMQKAYEEHYTRVCEFVSLAPSQLKEKAEDFLNKLNENKDASEKTFCIDVKEEFKEKLVNTWSQIPEAMFKIYLEKGAIQHTFKDEAGIKVLVKDFKSVAEDVRDELIHTFMELLYEDFVPEGMPKEVAEFIKSISNGSVLIPITAVFPDFDNDSDEDGEFSTE